MRIQMGTPTRREVLDGRDTYGQHQQAVVTQWTKQGRRVRRFAVEDCRVERVQGRVQRRQDESFEVERGEGRQLQIERRQGERLQVERRVQRREVERLEVERLDARACEVRRLEPPQQRVARTQRLRIGCLEAGEQPAGTVESEP